MPFRSPYSSVLLSPAKPGTVFCFHLLIVVEFFSSFLPLPCWRMRATLFCPVLIRYMATTTLLLTSWYPFIADLALEAYTDSGIWIHASHLIPHCVIPETCHQTALGIQMVSWASN